MNSAIGRHLFEDFKQREQTFSLPCVIDLTCAIYNPGTLRISRCSENSTSPAKLFWSRIFSVKKKLVPIKKKKRGEKRSTHIYRYMSDEKRAILWVEM